MNFTQFASLLLGLFLITPFNAEAQVQADYVDCDFGQSIKQKRTSIVSGLIRLSQEGYYVLQENVVSNQASLTRFNQNLKLIKTQKVDLGRARNSRETWFIRESAGELYFFSTQTDNSAKEMRVFVEKINPQSLAAEGEPREIASQSYEGKRKARSGYFEYSLSQDSSKTLIYYNSIDKKRENDQFSFFILDENFELLWKKDVVMPYEQRLFDVEDFVVDNFGEVHIIGKVFDKIPRERRKGKPNFKYEILSYKDGVQDAKKANVQLDDYYLDNMSILVTEAQDIICMGFYSEYGSAGIKGAYYFSIDGDTRKVKEQKRSPFSLDLLTQNLKERQVERVKRKKEKGKDPELYHYTIDHIIVHAEGGITAIAEQNYVNTYTYTNANGTTVTTHTYYNNDILIMRLEEDGELRWAERIGKLQVASRSTFSSYTMGLVNGNIYLIFNDNIKNLTREEGDGLFNFKLNNTFGGKNAAVSIVEVSPDGQTDHRILFAGKDVETIIRASISQQVGKKEVLLWGRKGKNAQPIRVAFD